MADTNFTNGTVILPAWLNDVNDTVYGLPSTASASVGDALVGVRRTFTNATASTQHAVNERRQINVMTDCGAVGDNTADDYAAINIGLTAAKLLGCDLFFPRPPTAYRYGTTLTVTDGVRLVGEGATNRWRSNKTPVQLNYVGSGSALTLAPGVGAGVDSVQIVGLQFNGSGASAGTSGLYLNATAASSYIEGVRIENCTFLDFPMHQALHDGTVFDVTYVHTTLMNPNVTADDCVRIKNGQPSQITFDDCWIAPYTVAKWGVKCDIAVDDLRFVNGTVAPYNGGAATGANGVYGIGGLFIYGTHFEGPLSTQTASIGIQYLGSNGAFISPSQCAYFGRGIVIGDGTATAARGWVIAGGVGNNNVAAGGLGDVQITAGGSRSGSIVSLGFANGNPTVLDSRAVSDGVTEVMRMDRGSSIDGTIFYAQNGAAAGPSLSFLAAPTTGFYNTGTGAGWAVGGTQKGELRSTDARFATKIYPGTPPGALQAAIGLYGVTGAPSNSDGANGDICFRSDGGALTTIYHKRAGSWVGVV